MNILMIGNGFDLAHGLPTSYKDFLKFVNEAKMIHEYKNSVDLQSGYNKLENYLAVSILKNLKLQSTLEKVLLSKIDQFEKSKFINYIEGNRWIKYFFYLIKNGFKKENWIDFELEISRVIQEITEKMGSASLDDIMGEISVLPSLSAACVDITNTEFKSKQLTYRKIRDTLYNDLNNLILAMEIYFRDFVECKQMKPDKKFKGLEKLKIEHVLSFNYTHTYEKLYGTGNTKYDYIHGEVTKSDSNNMVLGIDEYLTEEEKNQRVEFIAFKKYYQRIAKDHTNLYRKWIDNLQKKEGQFPHNLYIIGHSLDITDGDVLRAFILKDTVRTTIYYHTEDAKRQLIANLVKVIGQEQLIEKTGGCNQSIFFKDQSEVQET